MLLNGYDENEFFNLWNECIFANLWAVWIYIGNNKKIISKMGRIIDFIFVVIYLYYFLYYRNNDY